jgi:hypothetical protein
MKTYKYENYPDYIASQRAGYEKKKDRVWAEEKNIKFIAEWLKSRKPERGLCHGVRGGWEIAWFNKYLPLCYVYGTEIGRPSTTMIFQYDFNDTNVSWINFYNFIYSNSFDHAFDLQKTLNVWAEQLKPGGVIILEMDRRQEHTGEISKAVNKTDPVSITLDELIKNIPVWVKGAKVIEILNMPIVTKEWRKAIVIEVKK